MRLLILHAAIREIVLQHSHSHSFSYSKPNNCNKLKRNFLGKDSVSDFFNLFLQNVINRSMPFQVFWALKGNKRAFATKLFRKKIDYSWGIICLDENVNFHCMIRWFDILQIGFRSELLMKQGSNFDDSKFWDFTKFQHVFRIAFRSYGVRRRWVARWAEEIFSRSWKFDRKRIDAD